MWLLAECCISGQASSQRLPLQMRALKAGAYQAFRASVGSPQGIAFCSLVDHHGARSLPGQAGPGHGDIWLFWGRMPGMQAALQLNPISATGFFQVQHFGLMQAFFHLNLVTQEYFEPACHHKSLVCSRDKLKTRKKLFSELQEATLNLAWLFSRSRSPKDTFPIKFYLNITSFKPAWRHNCGFCPLALILNLQTGEKKKGSVHQELHWSYLWWTEKNLVKQL